jgi:3-hydroxyacyl-[acyl-carrier-protein] dehydratase
MRFLLVDRITEIEKGKRAAGIKNITLSEDFFAFHFPEHPIMPGALITECLVQLADWTVRDNEDFESVAVASAFDTVKFHNLVRPGDQLQLEVEVTGRENGDYQFRGEARCDGRVMAVGRFTMSVHPADELQPAEEGRRLYEMIRCGKA